MNGDEWLGTRMTECPGCGARADRKGVLVHVDLTCPTLSDIRAALKAKDRATLWRMAGGR